MIILIKVFYGIYEDYTEVAIKILKSNTMSLRVCLEEKAAIVRHCRHKKLVRLYGVYSKNESLLNVTEFMVNSSLIYFIRKYKDNKRNNDVPANSNLNALNLPDLLDMDAQIAPGMAYLVSEKVNQIQKLINKIKCIFVLNISICSYF